MRLEVFKKRVFLEHREAFRLRQRVRRDVEVSATPDPGERNQITSFLWLLALLVEPNTDFRARRDLLTDGVNVLVPGNLLARQDQLSRVRPEQVVTLADRPLHQLRVTFFDFIAVA